jgi:hypothetical protein
MTCSISFVSLFYSFSLPFLFQKGRGEGKSKARFFRKICVIVSGKSVHYKRRLYSRQEPTRLFLKSNFPQQISEENSTRRDRSINRSVATPSRLNRRP